MVLELAREQAAKEARLTAAEAEIARLEHPEPVAAAIGIVSGGCGRKNGYLFERRTSCKR
ncbi:hypothetical protein [Ensifer adhaerens]|nr:hypothetical protein [Ensifer adhaerens]MBW0367221.1 hypothetical protein [Ensifer adhaerens]